MIEYLLLKSKRECNNITEYLRYLYQNEIDKACFQLDIANLNSKDLLRRNYYVRKPLRLEKNRI